MPNPALSCFIRIFGRLVVVLLLACGTPLLVPSAMAQGHGHGGGSRGFHAGGGFHGGGFHGRGWYGGVGIGFWGWPYDWGWPYYWDWPYYGYPPAAYPAPATVIEQAPATPAAPPSWYYCADPKGYYPYVQSCKGAWQPVPIVPPGVVPAAPH